jgi:hypothetical protein
MIATGRHFYDRAMRLTRNLLAVLALAALVFSPAALAKQYAPPGKAGTSEYAEDIPTAGGNAKTPAEGGGNKTSAQIDHLGAGQEGVRKLAKLGKNGAAAAQFVQQTAPATVRASNAKRTTATSAAPSSPTRKRSGAKQSGSSATLPQQRTLTVSGGSASTALGRIIGGSDVGGIGILLPLLLLLGVIAAAAVAVARTRRPRSGASQT